MDERCYITRYSSPVGMLTLASDGDALTGLWIEGQKHFAAGVKGNIAEQHVPVLDVAARWLSIYFRGEEPDFMPRIRFVGTDFRKRVWQLLTRIPYGRVVSYGEVARMVAAECGLQHMSAQAVGGAVGHNPISIIVPCHRVVGNDGSLTGYAAGIHIKEELLRHEGLIPGALFSTQKR